MAVAAAITDSASTRQVEVITSLAGSLKTGGFSGRPQVPDDVKASDRAAARQAILAHLEKAAALVSARSAAEGEAYKAWLVAAASKVAEAAREGGFLGFGGTMVSEEERAALAEISAKLGVQA
jgi:hypothetical protein